MRVAKRSGALIPKPEFKRDSIRRAGELFFVCVGVVGFGFVGMWLCVWLVDCLFGACR